MKALTKFLNVTVCTAMIAACGGSKETTNNVPVPVDPTTQTTTTTYTPPVNPGQDPRLPALQSKAVVLRLTDPTTYTGLQELAQVLFLPLVGDPKVAMDISGGRDTLVTGKILVSFEDQEGYWGALLDSFGDTGARSSGGLDMIFADDEIVVRMVGSLSGDSLDGLVYYRIRQTGDTACKKQIRTCAPGQPCPQPDVTTPCRNYMQFGVSQVKQLGSFHSSYSNWVVQ